MVDITNTNATQDSGGRYTVCQRTGRKVKPGSLVKEWTGLWVLPEVLDNRSMQDFVRARSDNQRGSIRPEGADTFVSTSTAPSDL